MSTELRPAAPEVLAKTEGGRALLFHSRTGEGLPPHTHAGQAVIVAVLRGRLRLTVEGNDTDLAAGEVMHTCGQGHFSSLALEDDTKVLVTLLTLSTT